MALDTLPVGLTPWHAKGIRNTSCSSGGGDENAFYCAAHWPERLRDRQPLLDPHRADPPFHLSLLWIAGLLFILLLGYSTRFASSPLQVAPACTRTIDRHYPVHFGLNCRRQDHMKTTAQPYQPDANGTLS